MSDSHSTLPRLVVTDLSARRGGRPIFRGLSFTLSGGEALVVTGPNGSGKSTLLRLLTGLSRPDSGTIDRTPAEVDALRYGGHRDGLKGGLTVAENLAFWNSLYGAPEEDIAVALDRFDLHSVADMPVDVLSAGWRRRAGLARLVLGQAPLWILDEPYTALDADNMARIDGILSDHINSGGLVVLATHQAPDFTPAQRIDLAAFEAPVEELEW